MRELIDLAGEWNGDYSYPCKCDVAHSMIFDIAHAIDVWDSKSQDKEDSAERKETEAALRGLHLAARSQVPIFAARRAPERERIGCIHLLVLALHRILDIPHWYRKISQSYWAAVATVSVELINRAQREHAKLPNDRIVSNIRAIFRQQGTNVALLRDITNGFVDVMAETKSFGDWQDLEGVISLTLNDVFAYWLESVSRPGNYLRDQLTAKRVAQGAIGAIEIWRHTALLYADELKIRSNEQDVVQMDSLGREVVEKGLVVLNLLATFYTTFKEMPDQSPADRVMDTMHRFTLLNRGAVVNGGGKKLLGKAQEILQKKGLSENAKEYLGEIAAMLAKDWGGPGQEEATATSESPPARK